MLHDIAQDVDRRDGTGIGDVDVIHGTVETRVSVHVTAGFLHFLVDSAAGTRGRALEEHVFQNVGQACPQPIRFVNAAAHSPGLRRDNWCVVVLAHNDGEAVLKDGEFDAGWNRGDVRVGVAFGHSM